MLKNTFIHIPGIGVKTEERMWDSKILDWNDFSGPIPVKLSQRTPIPGQALFQIRRGYGKGCPWTCRYGRDIQYQIEEYPETLKAIDSSLALDVRFFSPLALKTTQDTILDSFRKVFENIDEVTAYAEKIDYVPLWDTISKLPPKEQIVEYVSENLDHRFQEQRK